MRRKTKILVGTVAAIALVCASGVWYFTSQPHTTRIATEVGEESEEQEVVVKINENIEVPKINENIEVPKIYETIVDESGDEVVAVCHPNKNGHRKASKNGMNRILSFVFERRPHLFHGSLDNEPLPT